MSGNEFLAWVPAGAVVLLLLGYLLSRRVNQRVGWRVEGIRTGAWGTGIVVTNTGTSKARKVRVRLEPSPRLRGGNDDPHRERDVDPGAVVKITYTLTLGGNVPQEVVVTWKRLLRRRGVWRSPI